MSITQLSDTLSPADDLLVRQLRAAYLHEAETVHPSGALDARVAALHPSRGIQPLVPALAAAAAVAAVATFAATRPASPPATLTPAADSGRVLVVSSASPSGMSVWEWSFGQSSTGAVPEPAVASLITVYADVPPDPRATPVTGHEGMFELRSGDRIEVWGRPAGAWIELAGTGVTVDQLVGMLLSGPRLVTGPRGTPSCDPSGCG